jgi:O-antigen ligase
MFKGVMISSIPFFPFYYFAQQGILKSKNLKRFFFLILPVTILQYYLNANRILLTMTSGDADIVNNISYGFVSLIPFVFLFKQKRIISIVCMTILLFYIIQGAKRGALIAGGIGLLGFIYFQFQTIDKKNKFKGYLLVTVAIICVLYFVYNSYESNDFLISRMQKIGTEAGWSGRNRIYTTIVDKWSNSNSYLNLIFGFGFAASLKLTAGYFAHNDWLELLSNFGLLGIFVYSYIFYIAIRMVRSEGWNKDKRMMMLTIILMWFFITLVSMSYTSNIGFVQIILIAYLVGSKSKTVAT